MACTNTITSLSYVFGCTTFVPNSRAAPASILFWPSISINSGSGLQVMKFQG